MAFFFKYSPKRQRYLEESITEYNTELRELGRKEIHKSKIKTMCQTRWVEKHTSMEDLDVLYSAFIQCFDLIVSNNDHIWDGKTITEANGLLSNITSPGFIAAFKVNLHIFGIKTVKTILSELRKDPEKEFKPIIYMKQWSQWLIHLD